MPCALCLQDRKLCRSHILPELFYKPIYDERPRRYFTISTAPDKKPLPRQKGIWEMLLCKECEGRLSKWEDYASRKMYQEATIVEKPGRLEVVELDYTTFKLFQLSLLWRAGVSKRPEFNDVSLDLHTERLRKMILAGDPGRPERYGCFLVLCPPYKDYLQRMIISPDMVKVRGHHVARFLLAGLFWNYFVSSHTPDIASAKVFLTEDGVLPIIIESEHSSQYLRDLYRRWKDSGNLDRLILNA